MSFYKMFGYPTGLGCLLARREALAKPGRFEDPYIFHPLKADAMDIRSPGPDKKPWTDDDLSLNLQDIEAELGL